MIKNNKKAFTLIELLIVISIIGILASIVLINLNEAKKSAEAARFKVNARKTVNAITQCCSEGNSRLLAPWWAGTGDQICDLDKTAPGIQGMGVTWSQLDIARHGGIKIIYACDDTVIPHAGGIAFFAYTGGYADTANKAKMKLKCGSYPEGTMYNGAYKFLADGSYYWCPNGFFNTEFINCQKETYPPGC